MIKNFTNNNRVLLLIILICFTTLSSLAQTTFAPKMKFRQPQLISGVDGQENATYKFTDVIAGVDAFIRIENMVNGATLVNIDDSTLGYYEAWQPTVGGPGTYGISYIKWDIEFKTTSGSAYIFPYLDASAVDVDGDNVRVREFVDVNGQSSYEIPNQIPSVLTVTAISDTDNIYGNDASLVNIHALGPVANRAGIDTFSQDVRIDYHFLNKSLINIYTGSQVDNNGTTGAIATNRYHCIYFMTIQASLSILPVTYHSFDAVPGNSKVNLYWISENEKSDDHFEIERSFDQKEFKAIGMILGAETVKGGSGRYNFKDENEALTTHNAVFYRLKYTGINGAVSYSNIKMVVINNTKMNVQILPNPYMDKVNVSFASNTNGVAEIKMFNTSGSLVKKTQSNINTGNNQLVLRDLKSQAPGLYIVNVTINGKVIDSQKLIKN